MHLHVHCTITGCEFKYPLMDMGRWVEKLWERERERERDEYMDWCIHTWTWEGVTVLVQMCAHAFSLWFEVRIWSWKSLTPYDYLYSQNLRAEMCLREESRSQRVGQCCPWESGLVFQFLQQSLLDNGEESPTGKGGLGPFSGPTAPGVLQRCLFSLSLW